MYEMNNVDKINIYVPERTGNTLKHDAEQFEIYKKNGKGINLNRFLSRLLSGYYQSYKQERNGTVTAVREIVKKYLNDSEKCEHLAENLMDEIVLPAVPKRKGKKPACLALKPTLETDQSITEIIQNLGQNDYISQYLCRMFMSYCEKPIYERERLVFHDETEFLLNACKTHREISFALTTRPRQLHRLVPYELVCGTDERFNYLLGQEYNDFTKKLEARSFRLCRIMRPTYCASSGTLEEKTIYYLEKMKKLGPQYAINEETETCVKLTPEGRNSFRMIYQGRPSVNWDRIEENPEDGSALYYFNASLAQLFLYFRRFNAGEATVIYPEKLRKQLYEFFAESMEAYQSGADPLL